MEGPKVGRGTVYHMIARGIFLTGDFVIHIYFARKLGPAAYGVFGIVLALLAIISQPLNIGLTQSVSKHVAEDHNRARTILYQGMKSQLILVVFLLFLFLSLSGTVADILKTPGLRNYMILAAIVLPGFGIFTIMLGIFNGLRYFGREAFALGSYPLIRTLAAVIFVYLGYGVDGVIYGFIIGISVSVILSMLLLKIPDQKVAFDVRKLRSFAVPVFIIGLIMIVVPNIDLLFVKGIVVEEKETGIYNSARVLARASYFFFLAIGQTIFPSVSESVTSRDQARTASYIAQGIRYFLMTALPVAFVVAAPGAEFLTMIFSRTYSGGGESFIVLMFGFTLLTLFSVLTTILLAGNRTRWALMACLFLLFVDVILNLLLVPRFQILGAAMATSLTSLLGVTVAGAMVWKAFHTFCERRSLLNIGIASGVLYLVMKLAGPTGFWIVPWILIALLVYAFALLLLGELKKSDWMVIRGILQRNRPFSAVEGERETQDTAGRIATRRSD
jgi:stage V sporulation protein B